PPSTGARAPARRVRAAAAARAWSRSSPARRGSNSRRASGERRSIVAADGGVEDHPCETADLPVGLDEARALEGHPRRLRRRVVEPGLAAVVEPGACEERLQPRDAETAAIVEQAGAEALEVAREHVCAAVPVAFEESQIDAHRFAVDRERRAVG